MAIFDSKTWNDAVFQKYLNRVPNTKRNELLKHGVLQVNPTLAARLVDGVGGNALIEPIKGILDGSVINYDGNTDITATSRETYSQRKIVLGRAKAWEEQDFSKDLTGVDFLENVSAEVAEYYQGVDQDDLLAILKGIFAATGGANAEFAANHTLELEKPIGATTLNSTLQKATGDNKGIFSLAFLHSAVATGLENLDLVDYLKYTDEKGIQRDLGLYTWNGRLVIVDDSLPVEVVPAEYALTEDVALDAEKTYYTVAEGVYTAVASPDVADIANYYERTAEEYNKYVSYVLGRGAIEYANIGAKVPSEVVRDALAGGGKDILVTRQRKLYAPKGFSFIGADSIISPTVAQLETGSNWSVVTNGKSGKDLKAFPHKAIPIARIISTIE